jgi:predicted enzyme related to lactoylglutathione lyase
MNVNNCTAVLQFYSSVVLFTLTSLQELVQDKIRYIVAKIDEKSIAVSGFTRLIVGNELETSCPTLTNNAGHVASWLAAKN